MWIIAFLGGTCRRTLGWDIIVRFRIASIVNTRVCRLCWLRIRSLVLLRDRSWWSRLFIEEWAWSHLLLEYMSVNFLNLVFHFLIERTDSRTSLSQISFKYYDLTSLMEFISNHCLNFTHVPVIFWLIDVKIEVNQVKIEVLHVSHLLLGESS